MRIFVVLLNVLLLFSPTIYAFELFPMVASYSDQGSKSEQFFQVNNTTGQPLPLEIFVKQRDVSGENAELLSDSDDFFIFPPQALIQPGKTQMVKVKYIGDPINISKSYRIVFSQLPIKDDATKSSIKMLFQIGALVFVSQNNVENNVTAKVTYLDGKPKGLLVENLGTGVIAIPELSFNVTSDHASHTWAWDNIKHLFDRQFLVPGENTRISVETLLSSQDSSALVDVKGYR